MSLDSSGVKIGRFDSEVIDIRIGTALTVDVSNRVDYRCSGLCDLGEVVLQSKKRWVPIGVEMVLRVSVKCRYICEIN